MWKSVPSTETKHLCPGSHPSNLFSQTIWNDKWVRHNNQTNNDTSRHPLTYSNSLIAAMTSFTHLRYVLRVVLQSDTMVSSTPYTFKNNNPQRRWNMYAPFGRRVSISSQICMHNDGLRPKNATKQCIKSSVWLTCALPMIGRAHVANICTVTMWWYGGSIRHEKFLCAACCVFWAVLTVFWHCQDDSCLRKVTWEKDKRQRILWRPTFPHVTFWLTQQCACDPYNNGNERLCRTSHYYYGSLKPTQADRPRSIQSDGSKNHQTSQVHAFWRRHAFANLERPQCSLKKGFGRCHLTSDICRTLSSVVRSYKTGLGRKNRPRSIFQERTTQFENPPPTVVRSTSSGLIYWVHWRSFKLPSIFWFHCGVACARL